jgi:hypothetical protein
VTTGTEALAGAYAKLRWAESRHDEMQRIFAAFALPENQNDRPYGILFDARAKPTGLVVATFMVEKTMPEEMSLLAADLVHNARVALDHTLARTKDRFGGNPGRGSFPICATENNWQDRVEHAASGRNPLHGLEQAAVDFVRAQQPLHRNDPENDPLIVLNELDNDDKHQLLHTSFVYPDATEQTGLDLIHVARPSRIRGATNSWRSGQPLADGTRLAAFMVRSPEEGILCARSDAKIGFAIGGLDAGRTQFTAMIERVWEIVDGAVVLIDGSL